MQISYRDRHLYNEVQYLFIWTSLTRYSQITVYSIQTFTIVQEIKNTFIQNNPSVVVDLSFDLASFQIIYLDNTGNINCFGMDTFDQNCVFKMSEFSDQNILPIGMTIDYETNNIFVYSSNQWFDTDLKLLLYNIFITTDGSLVDYDFQNIKENFRLTWGSTTRTTVYLSISSINLIIIGLYQGNYSKPIQYISSTENYFWICSSGGIVNQLINKTKQVAQTYDIGQIIQQQVSGMIGVFEIDEVNTRLFTHIIEQKLIYINFVNLKKLKKRYKF
ncbi:hypothetical protein TTHERM_000073252 (macronuclear) [Tetrahymena thermophila SB210]|uniref:Uncharacterized protein n=1 Tax=Tetrahymena thermophila (strain SB210) TaxID=312017 RepID=W7XAQ8_TETTS|nr:hypothetical protein TTHERM_000073252 [Tetrahymena thermophila SB210]EWS74422.1 hypothetical protein TTHERM_000073252 [Tetrahymena thermophila SB210]|eukprot:XP_012652999.1 hypothetical protein TTHERM_000073252 [Tetrahymena thermophila SB210]